MKNINCDFYDKSDEVVFVVKKQKSKTNTDLYVFSKDIGTMKKEDFKDDTISDVIFIDKAVYQDDTIYNLKFKISSVLNEPIDSIYMFQEKRMTKENKDYIIHDFFFSPIFLFVL